MNSKLRKIQIGSTVINVSAAAPTVNEDSADGFGVGSLWFRTATNALYTCSDATVGAAVWDIVTDPGALTAVSVDGTTITGDGAGVPLAAVQPIVEQKTSVGGAPSEVFTVTGAGVGDKCFLQLVNDGTNNVSILSANITGVNQLTVVFSADPANDTVFNVLVHP